MSITQGRAWSKEVEDKGRHLLTLEREGAEAAWGFSLVGGREVVSVERETAMIYFRFWRMEVSHPEWPRRDERR